MKILDTAKIKIRFKGIDENPLAIVTINLNDEIEIRFCPIMWKHNKTGLFFTMPSLKGYRYQNCVVVLNKQDYANLQKTIMQEFIKEAKAHYHPSEFELIEDALNYEKEEEVNLDDIPL